MMRLLFFLSEVIIQYEFKGTTVDQKNSSFPVEAVYAGSIFQESLWKGGSLIGGIRRMRKIKEPRFRGALRDLNQD